MGLWDSKPETLRSYPAIVLEQEVCAQVSISLVQGSSHDGWNSLATHSSLDLQTEKQAVSLQWKGTPLEQRPGFHSSSSVMLKGVSDMSVPMVLLFLYQRTMLSIQSAVERGLIK